MTAPRGIDTRLENWRRWCTARGRRGPDCMTGAICDDMRKNSGLVREGHSCIERIDEIDAVRIELGMRRLPPQQRLLLDWCYIRQVRPEVACRKLSIPRREFAEHFVAAQGAIEKIVESAAIC